MRAAERSRRVRWVLAVALGLNAAVALAKILYGRYADSLAIEADGYHSLTDGVSSLVAMIGAWLALRPPDARHPYGHAKLEAITATLIGTSLLLVASSIAGDAIGHLRDGTAHAPRIDAGAFVVLFVTLAVNVGVATYQSREARRLASELLASDAQHTRSDCFVTLGVLATAVSSSLGVHWLDVPAAIAVAILVGKAGLEIVARNARSLTDAAVLDAGRIRRIALGVRPVCGAHTIRTRGTPDAVFVDLRLSLPGGLSLRETALVTDRVACAIRTELCSVADVTIHPEPADGAPRRTKGRYNGAAGCVSSRR